MIKYLCAISASSSFQTLIKHLGIFFRLKYEFFNQNISYHFPHVTCFWLTSAVKVFSSCNLWGVRIWLSELWQSTRYKKKQKPALHKGKLSIFNGFLTKNAFLIEENQGWAKTQDFHQKPSPVGLTGLNRVLMGFLG